VKQVIHRLIGRTEPAGAGPAPRRLHKNKQFVGRSVFAGRGGGDQDFSGETGAERRWEHRDCCAKV
jgi:hypothetical protein